MLYWKPSGKGNVSFLTIITTSVLFGTIFNIVLHLLLYGTADSSTQNPGNSSLHYIITGTLLILVSALVCFLLDKRLQSRAYVSELNTLKYFTDELHRVSSEEEAYEVLCSFLRKMPSVDKVMIFSRDESSQDENMLHNIQYGGDPVCSMSVEECSLMKSLEEYYVNCIKENSPVCPCQSDEFRKGSYICIPIVFTKLSHVILQLYSKHANSFDSLTVFKIRTYMEIAKPVIASKRTLQVLSKKANTDRLTKLYNRSFLDPYLENQIEAANLTSQQVSLLMVDMDHFKIVNDTYGHIAGDYILTIFAELVLKCIRKTDLIARYGGDEFIVVLPSTNTETAEIIAKRIIDTVAQAQIPSLGGVEIPSITCSVGISTYPDHCSSKNDLIKTSDIALYSAKQSGRNCTKTFTCTSLTF